jgi:hypothetical protein
MNIEEIKESIAKAVDRCGDELVAWAAEMDADCVVEACQLAREQWPNAGIQMRRTEGRLFIHVTCQPIKEIRYEGTHLRVSTIEVDDPEQAMEDAGIEFVAMVGQPIGDQVWFLDCTNVPDPLPEWVEIFEISKELFDQYFSK